MSPLPDPDKQELWMRELPHLFKAFEAVMAECQDLMVKLDTVTADRDAYIAIATNRQDAIVELQARLEAAAVSLAQAVAAMALIQGAKTLAEAVGLAKDAALTGYQFSIPTPACTCDGYHHPLGPCPACNPQREKP